MKAVLVVSHGSHSPKLQEEVGALLRQIKEKSGIAVVEAAYLEITKPNVPDGIDLCVQKGATEIAVLLNFLNAGRHSDEDVPAKVREGASRHPGVKVTVSPPVGQQPGIVDLFLKML